MQRLLQRSQPAAGGLGRGGHHEREIDVAVHHVVLPRNGAGSRTNVVMGVHTAERPAAVVEDDHGKASPVAVGGQ